MNYKEKIRIFSNKLFLIKNYQKKVSNCSIVKKYQYSLYTNINYSIKLIHKANSDFSIKQKE
jgi:hypothetical protein